MLAAILFPNVSQTLTNSGLFDQVEHKIDKDCKQVISPELEGCEGGQGFGSLVYFACTTVKERVEFFPALAAKSKPTNRKAQGWIAVFDTKTETAKKLKYSLEF